MKTIFIQGCFVSDDARIFLTEIIIRTKDFLKLAVNRCIHVKLIGIRHNLLATEGAWILFFRGNMRAVRR